VGFYSLVLQMVSLHRHMCRILNDYDESFHCRSSRFSLTDGPAGAGCVDRCVLYVNSLIDNMLCRCDGNNKTNQKLKLYQPFVLNHGLHQFESI